MVDGSVSAPTDALGTGEPTLLEVLTEAKEAGEGRKGALEALRARLEERS